MLHFTEFEDNRQFISITIKDGTSTRKVLDFLEAFYPTIRTYLYTFDREEIALNLDNNIEYGFTLNQLRDVVNHIADAEVYTFAVDINKKDQRNR